MNSLQTPLLPGQTLAHGRYTIQRPLSEGGMGTLYLATDHDAFERTVVVKILRATVGDEAQAFQMRFAEEGRTLAALSYPTIPQIFAYFQDGPHTCIVMAYIDGHDLEVQLTHINEATGAVVPGKAYEQAQVLDWGIELCFMLEYLASRQPPVVHHDIKPANLVLSSTSNHLFLVDFGTAVTSHNRQQDASYGTPGYAPPEQYRGQSEPRSDVYALAATLYHLLTDDDPAQHRFAFPRLSQLGAVGEALRPALVSDVTQRSSATALRHRLEQVRASATLRRLRLPDGSEVANQHALAAWCASHWSQATTWLYKELPDEIETVWGNDLAHDLRRIVANYRDSNAGLDAALALLDPNDFGTQRPRLVADGATIDFGTFKQRASSTRQVTLTNMGRRYAQVTLDLPEWISTPTPMLGLLPGQHVDLELTAKRNAIDTDWQLKDSILVHTGVSTPLQLQAQTTLPELGVWLHPIGMIFGLFAIICIIPVLLISLVDRGVPAFSAPTSPVVTSFIPSPTAPSRSQAIAATVQPPAPAQGSSLTSLTLNGDGTIWNMAWSPDGQTLASVETNGAIQFWRGSDGTLLHTIKGYGDWLGNIAWSPDSQMIASGSTGSSIKLRNASDGSLVRDLDGSSATVQSVAWSADGATIASGSADGSVRLWRTGDGTLLRTLIGHSAEVQSVAFSRDGQWLASGSRDTTIKIWRVRDGTVRRTLNGHRAAVLSVAWSPDSTTLASGSDDRTMMLWRASDGKRVQTFDGPRGAVFSVAWSPDGKLVASGSADKAVRLWRVGSRKPPKIVAGVTQRTFSVAFTPDGHTLAAGGDRGTIQFWAMP